MEVGSLVTAGQAENAVFSVGKEIEARYQDDKRWSDHTENQLWFELVSCILGSRTCFETAQTCASHISQKGLLDFSTILGNPEESERELAYELSRPIFPSSHRNQGCRYRYPRSRSNYIVRTAIAVYRDSSTGLRDVLNDHPDEREAREVIKEKAIGVGFKQASLFLRNVSHSKDLAILDSHVLRYMGLLRLIENDPRELNLSSRRVYMNLERALQEYGEAARLSLSVLDLAIWVVMRLVEKEFALWQ